MKYLSKYIARLVAQKVDNSENQNILSKAGFKNQMEEAIVEYGLKNHSEEQIDASQFSVSKWEFLQQEGKSSWKTIPFEEMNIQLYDKICKFDAMKLEKSVLQFDSRTIEHIIYIFI